MPDRKRGLILEKEKGKSPCSQGIIKNKTLIVVQTTERQKEEEPVR